MNLSKRLDFQEESTGLGEISNTLEKIPKSVKAITFSLLLSGCGGGVQVAADQNASVDENYMQEVSEGLTNPFDVVGEAESDRINMAYGSVTQNNTPQYDEGVSQLIQLLFQKLPEAVELAACTKELDWVSGISPDGEIKYYANECVAEKAGATEISPSGPGKISQD